MSLAVWPSRTESGHGVLSMRRDIITRCAHEDETGTDESAKSVDKEKRKNGPSPCLDRDSNPGLLLSLDPQRSTLNR